MLFGGVLCGNGIFFNQIFFQKNTSKTHENTQNSIYQDKGTMQPAWYPYFNPKKSHIALSQSQTLLFEKIENPADKDFLHYELTNVSPNEILLPTQDGSLLMIREAKNPKGKWQAIEYWRYDWGFSPSFNTFSLKSKQNILFTAPVYLGKFQTEMRFKLKIDTQKNTFITSPTFKGSVNPSQFYLPPKCLGKKWDGFATK